MNGGLGASMANGSTASSMDALTQAYSGMQQYTASALPSLYGQSLLQQSIAGSQKEGEQLLSTHPVWCKIHMDVWFLSVFSANRIRLTGKACA